MSSWSSLPPGAGSRRQSLFGHPIGLAYLSLTEAWERFSFTGMQALLVLYMVGELLQPGHVEHIAGFHNFRAAIEWVYGPLAPQPLSSVLFGFYTSLVFLMPVFGGYLGDRWVGQHRMVIAGAVLMAAGHLMMVWEKTFLAALALLILGAGCLKGNISTQVGDLYAEADRRRADGFQIFSAGINLGVIVAPLICGTLGELLGFHYGFAAAGIGMLVSLLIYLVGKRHLPPDRIGRRDRAPPGTFAAVGGRMYAALGLVFVLTTCFLTAAGQLGNVYSLWIKAHVDRSTLGLTVPVTWFHIWTSLFAVLLTPLVVRLSRAQAQAGREPSMMTKMAIGLCCCAIALALLGLLSLKAQGGSVPWLLLLPTHLLVTVAYLYVWPVGLALFSAVAPPGRRAMFIGIFFLSSFVASNIVGSLGRLYAVLSPSAFWLMHASIPAAGALVVLLLRQPLRRAYAGSNHGIA